MWLVCRLYPYLLIFTCFPSKWCTCQLKYACSALDAAFADLITYLQRSCKNHAALPVVSAVQSRTMYLLEVVTTDNKPSLPGNKSPMFMEAVRRKTFSSWPHKEYRYRAVIKFRVLCCFDLHTHNKLITLWANGIIKRQVHS